MSRRKKDPLRPLTDEEPGPDPAQPVAGRSRRRGRPGHHAPGRRTRRRLPAGRPAPPADAPATPSPTWSPASTPRAWPPWRPATAAAVRPSMTWRRGSGSCARSSGLRPRRPTGRRPGRWAPCEGVCGPPPTASPRSRPTPSGRCSTGPATATSAPGPGARPARPCVAARPGRRSSPTRTPSQKKVDRGRLPPRGGDGPVGLVRRPGGAVPDGPAPRPVLAARGRAGPPAARVPPRRHGQGADAVPPGRRPGPPARA